MIKGEEADPVKSFVFREITGYSKRRHEEDEIIKDELEQQKREERLKKNKAWRSRRTSQDRKKSKLIWDDTDVESEKSSKCHIL